VGNGVEGTRVSVGTRLGVSEGVEFAGVGSSAVCGPQADNSRLYPRKPNQMALLAVNIWKII